MPLTNSVLLACLDALVAVVPREASSVSPEAFAVVSGTPSQLAHAGGMPDPAQIRRIVAACANTMIEFPARGPWRYNGSTRSAVESGRGVGWRFAHRAG